MKRLTLTVCVTTCFLVLAVGAGAQEQINFSDLPLVTTATPVPSGYGGLNWSNFWYVDPGLWAAAGPGYQNLLTHRDDAFIGGRFCGEVKLGCYGGYYLIGCDVSTGFGHNGGRLSGKPNHGAGVQQRQLRGLGDL